MLLFKLWSKNIVVLIIILPMIYALSAIPFWNILTTVYVNVAMEIRSHFVLSAPYIVTALTCANEFALQCGIQDPACFFPTPKWQSGIS